jgi:hypothetical protein
MKMCIRVSIYTTMDRQVHHHKVFAHIRTVKPKMHHVFNFLHHKVFAHIRTVKLNNHMKRFTHSNMHASGTITHSNMHASGTNMHASGTNLQNHSNLISFSYNQKDLA